MSENPTGDRPPETPLNFKQDEARIRSRTYRRVLELLESDEKIPPGQLLSFAAKIGFAQEVAGSDKPQIRNQNIFAIIKGLPEERQGEILNQFERELTEARKELGSGE